MYAYVRNVNEFLNGVYNYIVDNYHIIPRDFTLPTDYAQLNKISLMYTFDGRLLKFDCRHANGRDAMHTHLDDTTLPDKVLTYCSIPEKLAVVYIDNSIFHRKKSEIISTMYQWLPGATVDQVTVKFKPARTIEVVSHLEPSYIFHFLHPSFEKSRQDSRKRVLVYYFVGNIVNTNETYSIKEDKRIAMVRPKRMRRRRSRSRSPGASGRTRRRSRSRSRSPSRASRRSRSRSASRSRTNRRRSRSRS